MRLVPYRGEDLEPTIEIQISNLMELLLKANRMGIEGKDVYSILVTRKDGTVDVNFKYSEPQEVK